MSRTDETSPAPVACYQLKREYLYFGAFGVFFFTAVGAGFAVAAWWNVDGSFRHPRVAAVAIALFGLAGVMLEAWLVLAAWREKLCLTPRGIFQQRIFSSTELERADVIRIRWPAVPRGRALVIRSHLRQIRFHLGNFTRAEASAIVAELRNAYPPSIQEGFELFEKRFHPSKGVAKGNDGRRRWPMALFFAAVAVLSLALALSGRRPQSFYPLALMNAGAAVWLMSSARRPKADAARAGQLDGDEPAP